MNLKPIQTFYKGYRFRSRLEARWAVFFDACGVKWEYEPEGFDLGNGLYYLPDFLLHGLVGRVEGDLWVEVKGQMSEESARKILAFSGVEDYVSGRYFKESVPKTALFQPQSILVVGGIPNGENIWGITDSIVDANRYSDKEWHGAAAFDFFTIDFDNYPAIPGVSKTGGFGLFGPDYIDEMDYAATERAYQAARCARFERGPRA